MFYRLNEKNEILDFAEIKYADDCLETEKKIVRGFDGQLVFEDELNSSDYLSRKEEFSSCIEKEKREEKIKSRLNNLTQDFIQVLCGAVFEDIEERKQEFRTLHNELRVFQGKKPREYK